jgi:hypothetical protein
MLASHEFWSAYTGTTPLGMGLLFSRADMPSWIHIYMHCNGRSFPHLDTRIGFGSR